MGLLLALVNIRGYFSNILNSKIGEKLGEWVITASNRHYKKLPQTQHNTTRLTKQKHGSG